MRVAPLILLMLCACPSGETLAPLRPTLVADQQELRLGPVDLGVLVEGTASFSNRTDGETHAQAFLEGADGALEIVDTAGIATREKPFTVRVRFTPQVPGDVRATLRVQHDGEPGDDGSRTLSVAIIATGNPPPTCDDGNPCTADLVDGAGCVFIPIHAECDDGDACTESDQCMAGRCVGRMKTCDDGIACTIDACEAGACTHAASEALCDDGDACTTDVCDAALGCAHPVAPNGTACGSSTCEALSICISGACVTSAAPDGFPCDDGNPCTGGDTCQAGACAPGEETGPTPVVVHSAPEPVFPSPILGEWPAHVDALVPVVSLDPVNAAPSAHLVWRGAPANGFACFFDAPCNDAPACVGGLLDNRLTLHVSRIGFDGAVLEDVELSSDAIHGLVRAQLGYASSSQYATPAGTVAAAAAVLHGEELLVAALVNFASECDCTVGSPPGAPQMDTPIDTRCLPSSDALVVFRVLGGEMTVMNLRWLGPTSVYETPVSTTAHGPRRDRLLSMALVQDGLAVTWAQRPEDGVCEACQDCLCNNSLDFRTLILDATSGLQVRETSLPLNLPGDATGLRTIGNGPVLAASITTSAAPSPLEQCSRGHVQHAWLLEGMLTTAASDSARVVGAAASVHPDGTIAFWSYAQDGMLVDGSSCSMIESVHVKRLRPDMSVSGEGSERGMSGTDVTRDVGIGATPSRVLIARVTGAGALVTEELDANANFTPVLVTWLPAELGIPTPGESPVVGSVGPVETLALATTGPATAVPRPAIVLVPLACAGSP